MLCRDQHPKLLSYSKICFQMKEYIIENHWGVTLSKFIIMGEYLGFLLSDIEDESRQDVEDKVKT